MTRIFNAVLAAACTCSIAAVAAADANDVSPKEAISSLEGARFQWLDRIQFTSSFEEFRWPTGTEPRDLKDVTPPKDSRTGSGVFNRRNGISRIKWTPVPPATNGEDQLISSEVFAFAVPSRGGASGRITAQLRNDGKAGIGYLEMLSPLNLGGSRPTAHPFHFASIQDARVDEKLEKADATHVAILTTQTTGGVSFETRSVIWTEPEPPVLQSRHIRVVENGNVVQQFKSEASDFQNCPGGKVPRQVCLYRTSRTTNWLTLWRSSDLGTRLPADSDFEIPAPPNVEIVGIHKLGANKTGARVLGPDDLTKDNVHSAAIIVGPEK